MKSAPLAIRVAPFMSASTCRRRARYRDAGPRGAAMGWSTCGALSPPLSLQEDIFASSGRMLIGGQSTVLISFDVFSLLNTPLNSSWFLFLVDNFLESRGGKEGMGAAV